MGKIGEESSIGDRSYLFISDTMCVVDGSGISSGMEIVTSEETQKISLVVTCDRQLRRGEDLPDHDADASQDSDSC